MLEAIAMQQRLTRLPPAQQQTLRPKVEQVFEHAIGLMSQLPVAERQQLAAEIQAEQNLVLTEEQSPSRPAPKDVPAPRAEAREPKEEVRPPPAEVQPEQPARRERATAQGAQRDWVVAVMDLETTGAAQLAAQMQRGFTDQLRVFLGVRRIKVVDRGTQEQAMKEALAAEKLKSYSECVDESCQIPLGKALAASHILRSSLGRFGKTCTLNGELIDLRSEVTVAAATERAKGCDDDQLLDAAEKLVDGLISAAQSR